MVSELGHRRFPEHLQSSPDVGIGDLQAKIVLAPWPSLFPLVILDFPENLAPIAKAEYSNALQLSIVRSGSAFCHALTTSAATSQV